VRGREICREVRGREFDEDFLSFRSRAIPQAGRYFHAVGGFPVANIREEEPWDHFGGEKESNMDAILEWKREEGMRFVLIRGDSLVSAKLLQTLV